ncbi:MAG: serine acetyltransferase [Eubacterium sp.]|nr:serine acetyltransferase [Eubacterium sp.]
MHNKIEDEIKDIVNSILEDYETDRTIDTIELFDQPDTEVVADITKKLLNIVYPGYYRDKSYRFYNDDSRLTVIIEDVIFNLTKQISIVLRQLPENASLNQTEIEQRAKQMSLEFFKQIPKIREYTETDVLATFDGDPAAFNKNEIILCYPGLYAITINRLAHEMFQIGIPIIPRMMTEQAHSKTGIDIHPGATLGKYFFIDHGTGIVVGETTIIGDYVKVYQGVTIGALSTRGGQRLKGVKRHPTIEDHVTIYAGASILGGETVIGRGAVIGSNAFITKSVEPGVTVSIKNQQLDMKSKYDYIEASELNPEENWFYTI